MIPYQLTLEERPTYVHAKVVGERTAANALRFLEEAYAACVQGGHDALLLQTEFGDPAMPYFAETVAVNRGVNVRLFQSVDAAEKWLSEDC